jgi:hypothetical protein
MTVFAAPLSVPSLKAIDQSYGPSVAAKVIQQSFRSAAIYSCEAPLWVRLGRAGHRLP